MIYKLQIILTLHAIFTLMTKYIRLVNTKFIILINLKNQKNLVFLYKLIHFITILIKQKCNEFNLVLK